MAGYRHRYMLKETGLPGWMRFGFSPGWQGVSPTGLPPAGQLPQFTSFIEQQAMLKEQEVAMLESQVNPLDKHLKNIRKRLEELKKR